MTTQAEADEACERACAEAYAKALAKAYAEASEACTKIRKAHEACADIRKAYDKAIKGELSNPISKKIIEQPAQQSAVRGEPNHVEDVLAMVEPKIGCVNHDCDKCKAAFVQEPVKWSEYEPDGLHHNKPALAIRARENT